MKSGRRLFLVWLVILALPLFWTGQKGLQKYAVNVATDRAAAASADPSFWIKNFALKMPLEKASEMLVLEGESWTINPIQRAIYWGHDNRDNAEFLDYGTVTFVYTNGVGKKSWFTYDLKECGGDHCPYDKSLFVPTDPLDEADFKKVYKDFWTEDRVFGFAISTQFVAVVTQSGLIEQTGFTVYDDALNPLDGALRRLSGSSEVGGHLWYPKVGRSVDLFSDSIKNKGE